MMNASTASKLCLLIVVLLQCCVLRCVSGQVSLSLGTTPLFNNSAVVFADIGDESTGGSPLICTTTFRPCCAYHSHRYGDWYYPNGTTVPNLITGYSFYRTRGEDGTVRLHRRNNATFPVGTYYCEIPLDSPDSLQRLTVRVQYPEVYLSLQEQHLYLNNDIVDLDEIGEGSDALLCVTNKLDCCSPAETGFGGIGNWLFPDGEVVQSFESRGYYRDRGPSVVRLHHEMSDQTSGLFRCRVDGSSNEEIELTVGVYRQGEGIPDVTNIKFDRDSFHLTCTSTGGPATNVIWRKNGELINTDGTAYDQEQRTTSYVTATYENALSVRSRNISDYVSPYSCTVANSRGTSSRSLTLQGVMVRIPQLTVGRSGAVSCMSVIPASTIEWLDSEGRVVSSVNSQRQLDLMFNPVNDSIHNTQYTCRVTQGGVVERTADITVNVSRDSIMATPSQSGPATAGETHTLTCTISTIPGLVNTPTASWTYTNGSVSQSTPSSSVITFNPLRTSHAGQYICSGSVVSPALQSPLTDTAPLNVNVQIPSPEVTIAVDIPSGPLYVGSTTATLTCTVTLSDYVDTGVMAEVTWSRSGVPLSNTTSRVTITPLAGSERTLISRLTLTPLSIEDTSFVCEAVLRPTPLSEFITASDTGMISAFVQGPVRLLFRGVSYTNNSVLSIHDIGEYFNGGPAVLCITDRRPCCRDGVIRFGEWYYPDGKIVPISAAGEDFYRGRLGNQTIYLSRRGNAQSPTGPFCCELPDNSDNSHTLCTTLVSVTVTSTGISTIGERYQLECSVSGSTDTPTFTWFSPHSTTPLPMGIGGAIGAIGGIGGGVTRMVSAVVSNGSTHTSTLQFDQLQASHEGMYTCEVTVGTVTETRSAQVNVDYPTIASTVMDVGGTPTAGKSYSLICTVTGADRLNPTKTYQWFKDNTVVSGEMRSTLSFSSLSLSDAGRYKCNASVSSTFLSQPISAMSNTQDLILQIPPATVSVHVTASPRGTILTGSLVLLTCTIELSKAVDIAVAVTAVWSGPPGTQVSYTSNATRMNDTTYASTATLSLIRWLPGSGEFSCTVTVSSVSTFVTDSVAVDTIGIRDVLRKFQLKLGRTDDCITWNSNKAKEVRLFILEELLLSIAMRCQCELPKENLLNGVFSCQHSRNQTIYRSTIIATPSHNATELVDLIQDWVDSAPTFTIQWYNVKVDPMCPVVISSLGDPECDNVNNKT